MKIQRVQKKFSVRSHHTFAKCLKNNASSEWLIFILWLKLFYRYKCCYRNNIYVHSFLHSFLTLAHSPSSFHLLYPFDYCFVITTKMMAIFIAYERKLKNLRNSYVPMLCSHYIIIPICIFDIADHTVNIHTYGLLI